MKKLQGMTVFSMLLTAVIVIYLGIQVIRIAPIYFQAYQIQKAVDNLADLPEGMAVMTEAEVGDVFKQKLTKQFAIENISEIKPEQVQVTPSTDGRYHVSLTYQVRRHLLSNVSLLFDFNIEKEVKID